MKSSQQKGYARKTGAWPVSCSPFSLKKSVVTESAIIANAGGVKTKPTAFVGSENRHNLLTLKHDKTANVAAVQVGVSNFSA